MKLTADALAPPRAVLLALFALTSSPAIALHDAPAGAVTQVRYIAFGGFYADPDSGRGADSVLGTNYGYGRTFWDTRAWEVRAFGGTLETGRAGQTDFYQYGLGLDLFQHFGNIAAGHPYLVGGLGATLNDVDPDDEDGVSGYGNVGAGWRFAPVKDWGIRPRVDLRGVYDTFDSGQLDVMLGLTLEIAAGRETVVVQETVVEKVVEVPVVIDGDGDGVPDAADQCKDTVGGAKVEPDGCVRKQQVIVLPNIEFALNRSELTPAGREIVEQVVRFMNDQPEIELEVWGHTDATGSEIFNLRLSQKRSAAVVQYLTDKGIAAKRTKSAGFGETRPLSDNATEEGRERNRRVELNIRAPRAGGRP
jgi:OOP family OmpA-OmpF porin